MEFKRAKSELIQAIHAETYLIEYRSDRGKNLLPSMDRETAAEIVGRTKGNQASSSAHHEAPALTVWVFKPEFQGESWYVKFYFTANTVVISFHRS